jgi:S1-C subfamily serine protease
VPGDSHDLSIKLEAIIGTDGRAIPLVKVNATGLRPRHSAADNAQIGDVWLRMAAAGVGQSNDGDVSARADRLGDGDGNRSYRPAQTDAPINHGNSASPVVSTKGSDRQCQMLCRSMQIVRLRDSVEHARALDDLRKDDRIRRAQLGGRPRRRIWREQPQHVGGAIVSGTPDSAADRAG